MNRGKVIIVESKIIVLIIVFGILIVGGGSYGIYTLLKPSGDKEAKVFPELKSPVANITASATRIIENQTIVFNSSKSFDPDGEIVSYIWDFGDDAPETTNSTNISHTFRTVKSDGSPYEVTLTVIDDHSQDNETSINITVIPRQYKTGQSAILLSRDNLIYPNELNVSFEKRPFEANFTMNLSLMGGSVPMDIKANLSIAINDPENQLIYTNDYDITVSESDNVYLPTEDFLKAGIYYISMECKKGAIQVTYDLTINYL